MEKNSMMVGFAVIALMLASIVGGYIYIQKENTEGLKILAAGSLAVPFKEIAEKYREKYGINVYIETAGSIETVKKVSELGIKADVVAVADYHAIQNYLIPNYTSWYVKFARNELVITYTNSSRYASEINTTNWQEILKRDVRIGFSSPNDDPCGYRAVMMFYLADAHYHSGIFESVVENNTGIKMKDGNITVPGDDSLLNASGRVFIKQKSVSLLGDLETGNIDYAVEYLSVAKQHHLRYVRLPEVINLSNSSLSSSYSMAKVRLADGKLVVGSPINYAVTVPDNSPHMKEAYRFVHLLLGADGREIMEQCGQTPMLEYHGNVPEEIKP